jgi:hypothetical protein
MKNTNIFIIVIISLISSVTASAEIVKKSKSGICHDTHSSHYDRTKNFQPYKTIDDCLSSGGRLAKSTKANTKPSNIDVSTKYTRSEFGHGWDDSDKDCQNSRMETLISQSVGQIRYKTVKQCQVIAGKWISSFTGETIYNASDIDIDHVVALKWAWNHGANNWTKDKRVMFANDPANLISVELRLNRQKGAKGLDEWLPPKNQCQYIVRFLRVSKKYRLKLTASEEAIYSLVKQQNCRY